MKDSDREGPNAQRQATPEPQGQIDEARNLFETMAAEAKRRSERESVAARSRGPMARGLLALTIVAAVLAAATLVYGVSMFPDAPIRAVADGYKGKGGTARTQADFEAFVVWKTAMFTIFPSAFLLAFAFAVTEARQRRRKA